MTPAPKLPQIPVVRVGRDGLPALASQFPERLAVILRAARRSYTPAAVMIGDRLAAQWARRRHLPEAREIADVAHRVGRSGAWLLNLSYEWSCTSAAHVGADGHPRLLRVLDWQLPTLGSTVLAVEVDDRAGPWINLTWPGFVGCVQGLAPGRFAAAINQAPGPATGLGLPGDWLAARRIAWRSNATPPVMLLRDVFRSCGDFETALRRLTETPVTLPVIFTLVGTNAGDSAIVERLQTRARVHRPATAVTNHWLNAEFFGRSHSILSPERLEAVRACLPAEADDLAWVRPPVLNERTRLAMDACAADGSLLLEGYEGETRVTERLSHRLAPAA